MSEKNKQIVVAFVEPVRIGQKFSKWPLHITLTPWFNLENALPLLKQAAKNFSGFSITTGKKAMFGPKKNVPVLLVESADLTELHFKLIKTLKDDDAVLAWHNHILDNYRPHISKAIGRIPANQELEINSIFVVKSGNGTPHKRVVEAELKLR